MTSYGEGGDDPLVPTAASTPAAPTLAAHLKLVWLLIIKRGPYPRQESFVRRHSLLILLSLLLVATLAWNLSIATTPPANLRVLSCTTGGNTYATVPAGAGVSLNVSANATGAPSLCGLPAAFPQTYYVKTTLDGGKTWQWTYRLSDFGFPTIPPVTPPVTPPVIPPVTSTCPETIVPVTYTCKTGGGLITCTAPLP